MLLSKFIREEGYVLFRYTWTANESFDSFVFQYIVNDDHYFMYFKIYVLNSATKGYRIFL